MRRTTFGPALLTSLCLSLSLVAVAAPRPARAGSLRLTIVSAKIDGKKLDKKHEHVLSHGQLSDLACLSLPGLRDTAGLCGISLGPDGVTPLPPPPPLKDPAPLDALVRVEIGDKVIRTYPIPGSLTPRWEYGVVLDAALFDSGDYANFILYDWDGPGQERKLGDKLVKLKDLAKPGTRAWKGVGPAELTVKIEALPDGAEPRRYAFQVPADQQMAELARNAKTSGDGYVVVPVAEGEIVEVFATGKVQPSAKKHPERKAGPNGIPTIQSKIQFNQPGFRGCPGCDHAALIGQVGNTGMVIGEHKKFTVDNAGLLVLAMNDLKTTDNAGAFDVKITVSIPAGTGERGELKKKGSAADAAPSLNPRVIQQVIDSHGAELDACVAEASNPTGDIVLAFTISGDGTPMGVVVEKASPNLVKAGDCMKIKALRWKFPPPRGVVSARYPMSFSAG